jgi:hypothetical protein
LGIEVGNIIDIKGVGNTTRFTGTLLPDDFETTGLLNIYINSVSESGTGTQWIISPVYKYDILGVVWLDGEKITYSDITTIGSTVVMSGLSRGVNGTYIKDIIPIINSRTNIPTRIFDGFGYSSEKLVYTSKPIPFILDIDETNVNSLD